MTHINSRCARKQRHFQFHFHLMRTSLIILSTRSEGAFNSFSYFCRIQAEILHKKKIVEIKKTINDTLKIVSSLLLGGLILYWMYRGFDFGQVRHVLLHEMNWMWMLLSFPFGILAQMFRGWRWQMSLKPVGEQPRISTSVHAIFLSYAVSLVIPRIGEFARCGVLKRYDNVSFPKALGTVVTERAIDSAIVLIITFLTFMCQFGVFNRFFITTGTNLDTILRGFSVTGYIVTAICGLAAVGLLWYLLRRLAIYKKVKDTVGGIWQGIISLRNVEHAPRFVFYSLAIWACYFLHYYLTFFCFEGTSGLGLDCAMVSFIVGSIAVIVPTPNGAGPWHFAVKTMLILYGVAASDALNFVLIVHSIQTLLVVLLGIYAWLMLSFTRKIKKEG